MTLCDGTKLGVKAKGKHLTFDMLIHNCQLTNQHYEDLPEKEKPADSRNNQSINQSINHLFVLNSTGNKYNAQYTAEHDTKP